MLECLCCHLPKFAGVVSPTDKTPQVCPDCTAHYGNFEKRDLAHVSAWADFHSRVTAQLSARLDTAVAESAQTAASLADTQRRLAAATSFIESAFSSDPSPDLQSHLESAITTAAMARTESVSRLRSRAMAVLLALDGMHNDDTTPGTCSCGKRTADCREFSALGPMRAEVRAWERAEVARMVAGKDHGLPREHAESVAYLGTGSVWKGP